MAPPIEPPELAALADVAEHPRVGDWTLRSGLVRYAQPEPVRVSRIMEVVRRLEWALKAHQKLLERDGPAVWAALDGEGGADGTSGAVGDAGSDGAPEQLVELLRIAQAVDRLGDAVAQWASDPRSAAPDELADEVVAAAWRRLDEIGAPREERVPPPGAPGARRARGAARRG